MRTIFKKKKHFIFTDPSCSCACKESKCPVHRARSKRTISVKSLLAPLDKSKRQTDLNKLNERLGSIRARTNEYLEKIRKTSNTILETRNPLIRPKPLAQTNSAAQEYLKGFLANFKEASGLDAMRTKRDTTEQSDQSGENGPIMKINEKPMPCSTMESLKKESEYREDLQRPEVLQFMPELQTDVERTRKHCQFCGVPANEDVCNGCGKRNYHPKQPQFFEYIQGEPVSYQPRSAQQPEENQRSAESTPRYVYDRFGHRYTESNGKLRLMAPAEYQQSADALVGQPNYDGLARILANNQEVLDQTNYAGPDRVLPEPLDFAEDTIEFIHELARRQANYTKQYFASGTVPEAKSTNENVQLDTELSTIEADTKPINTKKSQYQIIPIKLDGQDGTLIVKMSPAEEKSPTEYVEPVQNTPMPMSSRSKSKSPKKVYKFESSKGSKIKVHVKNDKTDGKKPSHTNIGGPGYEILTIETDPYSGSSTDEDTHAVLEYLQQQNMQKARSDA